MSLNEIDSSQVCTTEPLIEISANQCDLITTENKLIAEDSTTVDPISSSTVASQSEVITDVAASILHDAEESESANFSEECTMSRSDEAQFFLKKNVRAAWIPGTPGRTVASKPCSFFIKKSDKMPTMFQEFALSSSKTPKKNVSLPWS